MKGKVTALIDFYVTFLLAQIKAFRRSFTKDTYIKELKDIMVDKVSALIVIFGAIYGPLLGLFRLNRELREGGSH